MFVIISQNTVLLNTTQSVIRQGGKMSNIDLDVKTVMLQEERTLRELQELKEGKNKLLSTDVNHSAIPEWVTLDQAVALKGLNKNTVKCNPYLRPGAGNPKMQRYVGGRLVFNRDEVVLPWLHVTDDNLLEYMTKTCGITHIPDKLRQKLNKAENRLENSVAIPPEMPICV